MKDWFEKRGWVSQHRVVTGIIQGGYVLDFGLPKKKLYVEIDGSSHHDKFLTDPRRDRILADLGWTGIRIPSFLVNEDMKAAKALVLELIRSSS
jgi:very-short-patch-repair endonuclease